MSKKTCLITGGAGFMASHLVQALLMDGWGVRILVKAKDTDERLAALPGEVEVIRGDFGNKLIARAALDGVETLYHYASTTLPATAYGNSQLDVASNLLGTLALLDEAVNQRCGRVVFPSSGGTVYGLLNHCPISEAHPTNPICSHGIVKLSIEHYLHLMLLERGLNYTILRYANPYGPRQRLNGAQGAVAVFANRILRQEPIEIWGDGSVVRDFIYIEDAISATILAATSMAATNQIYNVGCGVGLSLLELVSTIEGLTGKKATVRFASARPFDVPVNILSIEKAKAQLGWAPALDIRAGLSRTIEALQQLS